MWGDNLASQMVLIIANHTPHICDILLTLQYKALQLTMKSSHKTN